MAFKAVNLKDFSGGLNTAIDESMLPINQTADMMNMDILDTGALTVRKGWTQVMTGPSAQPIRKLGLLRKTDGNTYWIVGVNNKVYSAPTSNTPRTLKEAETWHGVTNATVLTPVWDYHVSGGQVSRVTTSGTSASGAFAVPSSAQTIEVYGRFGSVGASLKVDSAAWVSATGELYTYSGLSAGSHNLYVKPHARNSSAFEVTRLSGTGVSQMHFFVNKADSTAEADFATPTYRDYSFTFYDHGYAGQEQYKIQCVAVTGGNPEGSWGVGAFTNTTKYTFYDFGNWQSENSTTSRTIGWHTVTIRVKLYKSGYDYLWVPVAWGVDAERKTVGITCTVSGSDAPFNIYAGFRGKYLQTDAPPYSFNFDTYRKNGKFEDDCGSYSGWTQSDYLLTSNFQISGTQYDNQQTCDLDKVYYQGDAAWSTVVATTTSNDLYGFAQLNNKMWVGVSGTHMHSWDGTTVGTITGTCFAGFVIENKRRLWAAGDWKTPDRSWLGCTDVDEGNDWRDGETFHLQGRDTDYYGCTGLGVWDRKILYTGEHCLYGFDVSALEATQWLSEPVSVSHGCIAPQTFTTFPRGIIFLSDDGVRAFGYIENVSSADGSGLMMLSENINNLFESMDKTAKRLACGAFFGNRYYLSVPLNGADHNTHILVCDLDKRTKNNQPVWTIYDVPNVTALFVHNYDGYKLYAGLVNGNIAQLMTGTTDNGSTISAYYNVPPITVGGYDTLKHYKRLNISAQCDQTIYMTVTPTTDDVYAPAQSVPLSPSSDTTPNMVKVSSRGHYLKLKLQASVSAGMTVNSVTVMVSPAIRVK